MFREYKFKMFSEKLIKEQRGKRMVNIKIIIRKIKEFEKKEGKRTKIGRKRHQLEFKKKSQNRGSA